MSSGIYKTPTHTLDSVQALIDRIKYKDGWKFQVQITVAGFAIHITFVGLDISSGQITTIHSSEWFVSHHSTNQEIVNSCFLAIQMAEIDYMHKSLLFDGKPFWMHPAV